ncbi:epoxide hydrolase family protein [Serratia marcescens]|uniref:epoxide hydrolase family protein n=1 Tax=Serratia marcescens TaxID=615 RepID=UPI00387A3D27
MCEKIEPFHLAIPETQLDDLRRRLGLTRWPTRETVQDTSQGPQLAKIQALCSYWLNEYDWRKCESLLNGYGQYKTTIEGLGIHFLHIRSPEPDALPLLMCHGWPGSVLEFRDVIGPLSNPAAYNGNPRNAFHLIIPSMPGFGFSDKPGEPGWALERIADSYVSLMARLGYQRWVMQGGDLGAAITDTIALKAPVGCIGMHSNFAMFQPTSEEIAAATPDEKAMLASSMHFWDKLSAYARQQQTRPQTLGYALADSPVAQAAWIYQMFQDTCGTPGNAEGSFTFDQMLDDIMLYWLPNAGASSARLYWEMVQTRWSPPASLSKPITLPTGFTMAPLEAVRKSKRWTERRYTQLIHFNELAKGGHFVAMEQPVAFVEEVRATFVKLR